MTKIKDEETRPARLITIPKYQRWILSVIAPSFQDEIEV